jgi:hypothetical protein
MALLEIVLRKFLNEKKIEDSKGRRSLIITFSCYYFDLDPAVVVAYPAWCKVSLRAHLHQITESKHYVSGVKMKLQIFYSLPKPIIILEQHL